MYAKSQLATLLSLLIDLNNSASSEGCDGDLTVIDANALAAVMKEAEALAELDQVLILGQHEHKHGDSHYAFLVPQGTMPSTEQFEGILEEPYEPEHDEHLHLVVLGSATVFDPRTP